MRRLRQVLLVEANATGDQVVSTRIEECVGRLSCGEQHFGRYEAIDQDGVDVKVTLIGHAQQYTFPDFKERDAPKVGNFALRDCPMPDDRVQRDEVIAQLLALRERIGADARWHEIEKPVPGGEPCVVNRSIPAIDYAVAVLRRFNG